MEGIVKVDIDDWDQEKRERRESRSQRKVKQRSDRSKYKESNIKTKPLPERMGEELLRGRVVAVRSQEVELVVGEKLYLATLRGALKKEFSREKNLVVVGDWVEFLPLSEDEGVIQRVAERASTLARGDNLSGRERKLICANVDYLAITQSVADPTLNPPLVDRYIIAAGRGGMKPLLILNKIDLLKDEDRGDYEEFIALYRSLGVPLFTLSVRTGEGIQPLQEALSNKTTVFSGPSGVGKSSILRELTSLPLEIGDIVARSRKGSHTTVRARLLPIAMGGFYVDTPGIRSFFLASLSLDELNHYFREIFDASHNCRYRDCLHDSEDGCFVLQQVKEEKISWMRYRSFRTLVAAIDGPFLRR